MVNLSQPKWGETRDTDTLLVGGVIHEWVLRDKKIPRCSLFNLFDIHITFTNIPISVSVLSKRGLRKKIKAFMTTPTPLSCPYGLLEFHTAGAGA